MDPLSNVLSLLQPVNYLSAGLEADGPWAIQFPDQDKGIKTGAVVTGRCWLSVEGVDQPVLASEGDCFLLPSGRPFRLASDPTAKPVSAASVFSAPRNGAIASMAGVTPGTGDFLLVSSRFAMSGTNADMLLKVLPPIVHIRSGPEQTDLRWAVEGMMRELWSPQPGAHLIVQHLAQMLLVRALRLYLADGPKAGTGWLFALADRQMCAAVTAMHQDPARRWTLEALVSLAGMSRSSFALRFKATVGTSPMDYLAQWRMALAADRLTRTREPISAIAPALGYESETAFSLAFKKVMGCPPRQYGRDKAVAAPAA